MKKDIHPTYHPKAKITCSCGNVLEVGSTVADTHVEICSNCHPFFTGKQKFIDTAGRIDRFKAKLEAKNSFVAKPVTKETKEKTDKKEAVEATPVKQEVAETETPKKAPKAKTTPKSLSNNYIR